MIRLNRPCYVYMVWDTEGRLVYVGIADDWMRRYDQHEAKSWWMREIHVRRMDVFEFPDRWEARLAEASAINEMSPIYNTMQERPMFAAYLERLVEGDVPRPLTAKTYTFPEVVKS